MACKETRYGKEYEKGLRWGFEIHSRKTTLARVVVNEGFMPIKLFYGVNSSLKNCRAYFPIDIWSEIRNTMSWYQNCIVRSASAISLRLITVEVDWLKKTSPMLQEFVYLVAIMD